MRGFRDNFVFSNYPINVICDELHELVSSVEATEPKLLLTGLVAYFLQRGADERLVNNIVFKTANIDVYNELAVNINKLAVRNILKYKNRILCESNTQLQTVYFEIWLDIDDTDFVNLNGVLCEKYDQIKSILL